MWNLSTPILSYDSQLWSYYWILECHIIILHFEIRLCSISPSHLTSVRQAVCCSWYREGLWIVQAHPKEAYFLRLLTPPFWEHALYWTINNITAQPMERPVSTMCVSSFCVIQTHCCWRLIWCRWSFWFQRTISMSNVATVSPTCFSTNYSTFRVCYSDPFFTFYVAA